MNQLLEHFINTPEYSKEELSRFRLEWLKKYDSEGLTGLPATESENTQQSGYVYNVNSPALFESESTKSPPPVPVFDWQEILDSMLNANSQQQQQTPDIERLSISSQQPQIPPPPPPAVSTTQNNLKSVLPELDYFRAAPLRQPVLPQIELLQEEPPTIEPTESTTTTEPATTDVDLYTTPQTTTQDWSPSYNYITMTAASAVFLYNRLVLQRRAASGGKLLVLTLASQGLASAYDKFKYFFNINQLAIEGRLDESKELFDKRPLEYRNVLSAQDGLEQAEQEYNEIVGQAVAANTDLSGFSSKNLQYKNLPFLEKVTPNRLFIENANTIYKLTDLPVETKDLPIGDQDFVMGELSKAVDQNDQNAIKNLQETFLKPSIDPGLTAPESSVVRNGVLHNQKPEIGEQPVGGVVDGAEVAIQEIAEKMIDTAASQEPQQPQQELEVAPWFKFLSGVVGNVYNSITKPEIYYDTNTPVTTTELIDPQQPLDNVPQVNPEQLTITSLELALSESIRNILSKGSSLTSENIIELASLIQSYEDFKRGNKPSAAQAQQVLNKAQALASFIQSGKLNDPNMFSTLLKANIPSNVVKALKPLIVARPTTTNSIGSLFGNEFILNNKQNVPTSVTSTTKLNMQPPIVSAPTTSHMPLVTINTGLPQTTTTTSTSSSVEVTTNPNLIETTTLVPVSDLTSQLQPNTVIELPEQLNPDILKQVDERVDNNAKGFVQDGQLSVEEENASVERQDVQDNQIAKAIFEKLGTEQAKKLATEWLDHIASVPQKIRSKAKRLGYETSFFQALFGLSNYYSLSKKPPSLSKLKSDYVAFKNEINIITQKEWTIADARKRMEQISSRMNKGVTNQFDYRMRMTESDYSRWTEYQSTTETEFWNAYGNPFISENVILPGEKYAESFTSKLKWATDFLKTNALKDIPIVLGSMLVGTYQFYNLYTAVYELASDLYNYSGLNVVLPVFYVMSELSPNQMTTFEQCFLVLLDSREYLKNYLTRDNINYVLDLVWNMASETSVTFYNKLSKIFEDYKGQGKSMNYYNVKKGGVIRNNNEAFDTITGYNGETSNWDEIEARYMGKEYSSTFASSDSMLNTRVQIPTRDQLLMWSQAVNGKIFNLLASLLDTNVMHGLFEMINQELANIIDQISASMNSPKQLEENVKFIGKILGTFNYIQKRMQMVDLGQPELIKANLDALHTQFVQTITQVLSTKFTTQLDPEMFKGGIRCWTDTKNKIQNKMCQIIENTPDRLKPITQMHLIKEKIVNSMQNNEPKIVGTGMPYDYGLKGCAICNSTDNLCVHSKDKDDITCEKCYKGRGNMTSKMYTSRTTDIKNIRDSPAHAELLKRINNNNYLTMIKNQHKAGSKSNLDTLDNFYGDAKSRSGKILNWLNSTYVPFSKFNPKLHPDYLTTLISQNEYHPESLQKKGRINLTNLLTKYMEYSNNKKTRYKGLGVGYGQFRDYIARGMVNLNHYQV